MKVLGKLLNFFGYVLVSFCIINAFFGKQPLYPTYIPGVNQNSIIFFWIIFIYQIPEIYIASFILLSYIHSTLTFIMFGVTQIQILNHKLGLLSSTENELNLPETSADLNSVVIQEMLERLLRKKIISCIKFHLEIKR